MMLEEGLRRRREKQRSDCDTITDTFTWTATTITSQPNYDNSLNKTLTCKQHFLISLTRITSNMYE